MLIVVEDAQYAKYMKNNSSFTRIKNNEQKNLLFV